VRSSVLPSRQISIDAFSPGVATPTRCDNWPASLIEVPLNFRMTSPTWMPAYAAALSGTTLATNAPLGDFNLKESAND
jgi:hypothetical protein